MEPPNNGHFGAALFVLCKEVVLFGRLKVYIKHYIYIQRNYFGTSSFVLCREAHTACVSLFRRAHYWRFYCTLYVLYCVHACIVFCYLFAVQSDLIYEFYIVK